MFVHVLRISVYNNKQQPKYRAFQLFFFGLGGQGKSRVWQYSNPKKILNYKEIERTMKKIKIFTPDGFTLYFYMCEQGF